MEVKDIYKEPYRAPEAVVLEVKSEGIICASGGGEDMEWL